MAQNNNNNYTNPDQQQENKTQINKTTSNNTNNNHHYQETTNNDHSPLYTIHEGIISNSNNNNDGEGGAASGVGGGGGGDGVTAATSDSAATIETPLLSKPIHHVQFGSNEFNRKLDGAGGATDQLGDGATTINDDVGDNNGDDDDDDDEESSSSSSSSGSSTIEISEARPPDGGWGWVVVAAAFVVNLIADGITFSFGVIFVEFLKYFGQNRGTTAWIGSLFMAMPLLSGPIASFLTDRYGCRKVTIFGSVLASIGFIISSQANSMTVLCITFGILAGFGLSLCYVASVVIVAYYFDRKRSFATGLAVCGSGIGTFIFAPFIQLLLHEYGWRGTTLILAGLFLNLAVCGALMRDLPWTTQKVKDLADERKRNRKNKRKGKRNNNRGSSVDTFSCSNSTNTATIPAPSNASAADTDLERGDTGGDLENAGPDRLCSSLVNLPTYVRNGEKVPLEVLELLAQHKHYYNVLLANYPGLLAPSRSFSDSGRLHESGNTAISGAGHKGDLPFERKRAPTSPPRTLADHSRKLPTAFLRDLRVHRLSVTYRGAMLNINRYRLRASSCPDIYRNSMTTIAKEKTQWYAGMWDFRDLLIDMFDLSHFSEPKFLLFAISNFLLYTWYDVPYVYLTDNATTLGFSDDEASILISIIGIINMIGEVILGWLGDRPWANAGIIYAVCMGLCGAVTALVPLIHNYWPMCVVSGAFGFFIAANYSLTCIILVELITLDRFTNAYGLLLLVQGVANLIGPPLGGWLYDQTDNYHLSFYLAGLFIAISGLMLVIMPATNRCKRYVDWRQQRHLDVSIENITAVINGNCNTDKVNGGKFNPVITTACLTKSPDKERVKTTTTPSPEGAASPI